MKADQCPNWTQDKSEIYRESGLCEYYGRHTGYCLRQEQNDEFKKCESKGRKE